MRYQEKLFVPNIDKLRSWIIQKAHGSHFLIHSSSRKMYHDNRKVFLGGSKKRCIAKFVSKCLNCQQVKVEHKTQAGLLQEMQVPAWKWEDINID